MLKRERRNAMLRCANSTAPLIYLLLLHLFHLFLLHFLLDFLDRLLLLLLHFILLCVRVPRIGNVLLLVVLSDGRRRRKRGRRNAGRERRGDGAFLLAVRGNDGTRRLRHAKNQYDDKAGEEGRKAHLRMSSPNQRPWRSPSTLDRLHRRLTPAQARERVCSVAPRTRRAHPDAGTGDGGPTTADDAAVVGEEDGLNGGAETGVRDEGTEGRGEGIELVVEVGRGGVERDEDVFVGLRGEEPSVWK
jgi:hypothetical protein